MVDRNTEVRSISQRHEDTTVSRMELTGIILCLSTIMSNIEYFKNKNILYIVSDSEYAVLGISERMVKWERNGWRNSSGDVINLDLWKTAHALHVRLSKLNLKINLCWMKGHSNHKWNNRVDELADYKS